MFLILLCVFVFDVNALKRTSFKIRKLHIIVDFQINVHMFFTFIYSEGSILRRSPGCVMEFGIGEYVIFIQYIDTLLKK